MTDAKQADVFLANLALFAEASAEQRAQIASHSRHMRAARGEVLFRRGDPAAGLYGVVYGQVKLSFVSAGGMEKVVDIIDPGRSFGGYGSRSSRFSVFPAALRGNSAMITSSETR